MNIYDVSKQAGVSIATVSRVLNDVPGVSKKTREKVLRVMAQLGYEPNAFARGLGLNSMKTIGLLCADFADPFLAQAISYLERLLRENGYSCLLCCTGYEQAMREHDLSLLISKRVDALIFVGSNFISMRDSENAYILSAAQRLPVMLLNGQLAGANVYCTLCDDEQISHLVTDMMICAGRKNPLYLYHMHSYAGERKITGFRRAMEEHGLSVGSDNIHLVQIESAQAQLTELLPADTPFDAVFTSDDALGVAVLKHAARTGIAVPDRLAIIGYNNSALARWCEPELSSIDNKLESICQRTVHTLMGVLSNQDMPKSSIFSGEFVKRGTT